MRCFLVEIALPHASRVDAHRAARALLAAQARLEQRDPVAAPVVAALADDGRLLCVLQTRSVDAVRSLVALAMLPAPRIHELEQLLPASDGGTASGARGGGHPVGDARPRAHAELVEDVVDVRLDGAL
ncbi:hypothetical protein [Agrococcus beijingensis]|uniref:hypothetical protein n=1 Tax=Agrococcus beijingensis TaxID=3068634 RepID=UPI00274086B6|nr:hypothetical protein [Agrococcus sp. REN33]